MDGGAKSAHSRFWDELAAQHANDLEAHGLAHIKRKQAFKYFNWNWRWTAIRSSEQFRFLLRESRVRSLMRAALIPADASDASWQGAPLSRADRYLYAACVRLLWDYAQRAGDRDVLALEEPSVGNPLPVHWRGRLISQDLANTALEVAAMKRALAGRAPRNIVEIGAGYGRTAYALLQLFPDATYTIVDIEPALTISRWYLSQLFPATRLRFVHADHADSITAHAPFDLAVSISSLQEMLPNEVARYTGLLDRVVDGVVYFKQWTEWTNPRDGVTLRFDAYPIPQRWSLRCRERCDVQTRFSQAAWILRR